TVVVGVNRFGDGRETPDIPTPDYSSLERGQVERTRAARAKRDGRRVKAAIDALRASAACYGEQGSADQRPALMPLVIDAVRARATVGEIAGTLAEVWGKYLPP
ncbi:MAG TPA: methylmalonyl-CoA mutase family protein, partial [Gemmatimonadaceae bacterium]|nr:methylmalonyl-CoA mutase family protein [Gemmatimonadaceae bacterium]